MKQLSSLTKIMFCILAVLLVITVILGVATAIKDSKGNETEQGGNILTSTPAPPVSSTPDNPEFTPEPTETPTPEPTATTAPTETPTPEPTPTEAPKHIVAIDPGQQLKEMTDKEPIGPGSDVMVNKMSYGAKSTTTNQKEYIWTLILSKKLKEELELRGYGVIMTREEHEVSISNAERAKAISETDAEIYISIQADAAESASANGIYTQTPEDTNAFLSKELIKECQTLAGFLQNSVIDETGAYNRKVKKTRDKDIVAINYSKVPTAIMQLGFMTNEAEDTKLWTEEYQNKLVKGICDGIDEYFDSID